MSQPIATTPEYPLRLTWHPDGVVQVFEDEKDTVNNLEDFDSDDPEDRSLAFIVDAQGWPVAITVRTQIGKLRVSLDDERRTLRSMTQS